MLNGHLDTFPIGEARWEHHPLGADLEEGRIYGRGACDMKAGVAALALAFVTLAEFRDAWSGELVLTLVGDEETGGRWGAQYLLANVERILLPLTVEPIGRPVIAGLPKAPSRFNPTANPEQAVACRGYVLRRMRELGYIDQAEHAAARDAPVTAKVHLHCWGCSPCPYVPGTHSASC